VPETATEAFIRFYNGNTAGKTVYWDNLSVREIIAPFGPSWSGGATGGPAAAPYTTLEFPQPVVAPATLPSGANGNLAGGGWTTFSLNADGTSYTPEPGAEGLVLTKPDASTFRITDTDGTISDFTEQGAAWTLASSRTTQSSSTTRYVYDTTNFRALIKKVINPVEPGVDDANSCTATLVPGCEALEYIYATATTSGLSQTVFGSVMPSAVQCFARAGGVPAARTSAAPIYRGGIWLPIEVPQHFSPQTAPELPAPPRSSPSLAAKAASHRGRAISGPLPTLMAPKTRSGGPSRWKCPMVGPARLLSKASRAEKEASRWHCWVRTWRPSDPAHIGHAVP
jgi:hypothetical protein